MKELLDALKKINTEYPILLEYHKNAIWCIDGRNILWVEDDYYYNTSMPEGLERNNGYMISNLSTGTGTMCTSIFQEKNEIKYEQFEDRYGKYM